MSQVRFFMNNISFIVMYNDACKIADQVTVNKCTNGDVRLVNGNKDNEGRVEYCYNGQWSPMCSLNTYTARLVCKKLGYKKYNCEIMNM